MTGIILASICCGLLATCIVGSCAAHYIGKRGFPLPSADGRLGCVDGLRGYLATFVMSYHFILYIEVTRLGQVWSRPTLPFFDSLGAGSVNLFFMTTGFLFYPRIIGGVKSLNWLALYVSRVFRIIPLLIFLILAASMVTLARLGFHPAEPFATTAWSIARWIVCWDQPDIWGYPGSGQLGSALWSLWFEWLFYIFVLPICAVAMTFRGRAPTLTVPLILISISICMKPFHLSPLFDFLPLFGIGMIAFELKSRTAIPELLTSRPAILVALFCLAAGAIVPSGPLRMLFHGVFFLCVASGCSLGGLLKLDGARVLGEVSYGIYILHMLILDFLFVSLARPLSQLPTEALPAVMPVAVLAVLVLATTTFIFVERPGIRAGKAIAGKMNRRISTPKGERATAAERVRV